MKTYSIILLCVFALCSCEISTKQEPPNILFIMADDHTSQAFGLYDNYLDAIAPVDQIKRLRDQGALLNAVYCTNAICVPSRAAILTGQYSHLNGVYTLSDSLDSRSKTVAHRMQAAGYQTALMGKWHLKSQPQGFDDYIILPGQGKYHDPEFIFKESQNGERWNKRKKTLDGEFSTDVITDFSLDWLNQREKDKPFFLMTHFKAVHEPFSYHPRYQSLFEDQQLPYNPSLLEDLSHRSNATQKAGMFMRDLRDRYLAFPERYPKPALNVEGLSDALSIRKTYQKFIKDYLRSVAGINDNLGRILDYLDQNGLAENTVVIYTSDQGYFLGEHGYIDKRMMFEESAKMPFVIRYPEKIAAGSTNDDFILNIDFAPFFLEVAGESQVDAMQGRSFLANLTGATPEDWRDKFYYRYWMQEKRPAHYGLRTKRFKLINYYARGLGKKGVGEDSAQGWELYDLQRDPKEMVNVYDDPNYSKYLPQLKRDLEEMKIDAGDF